MEHDREFHKVYVTRNFLWNLLGRASKWWRMAFYCIIAFLVAEVFKILIYANKRTRDVTMWTQVYRIEILQGWCAAKTTHCDSGYDVTIATYLLPDFYLEWKIPYLLLQSLTDFLMLVLCNLHIRSQALNEQQGQIQHFLKEENSGFMFWMERAWNLSFHGNVTMDIIFSTLGWV